MLSGFFVKLKDHKIPVSIKEWLTLLEAMQKNVISPSIDEFYYLSRTALVKDEQNFDKFDRAFGEYFKGIESIAGIEFDVPLEWLLKHAELNLSPEEKAMIEALGGWEKLMEALKKRLEEQKGRHQGGNKWIGTAGTSPFGAHGYNPEGVRIGQDGSRNRSAVKVWDQREYRNLDDSVELGTRNIKVALRRLRKFAREGAPEELDLDTTIDKTARNAGYLDLSMRPERHNAVKVLMFLDIGGSMDDHVKLCEELFAQLHVVVHRAADVEEHQHLDGVVALRAHAEVENPGVARGLVDGGVEVELLRRPFARELAEASERHRDVARAELDRVVQVAVLARIPHLDRAPAARLVLADAHALGVVAVGAERGGARGADPLVAALVPAFLLFQPLFQRLHELFPAAHRFDHRLLFGRKVQLGLLEQPFERHVELDSGDRLDSLEVFAEGAVELVEILLVLHQRGARQIVELVDRGRDDALLHRLQERQPLLDRSRDPVVLELDEESGEHGAKAAGLGALAH